MNNINDLKNLKDIKALRRERKKRPRMRQHGRNLKKNAKRSILHIAKVEKDNPHSLPLKLRGRRRGL